MSGLKVLIVGASIAGPATAYWMAKAGAKVTVIERFPELRIGGQAVDIRTSGVSVMRKTAGMEALVRAKKTPEEGVSFVRDDGTPYGTIRATGNPEQQSIVSEYEILRGDLSRILFDLTQSHENIGYVFGEQITALRESDGGDGPVMVEFAGGSRTATYDLVVACDGVTSRTRAMAFGYGVRDFVFPTNSWAAFFSIKQDMLQGSRLAQGCSAVGGRFMSVGADASGSNRVLFMGIQPRGSRDRALPFRRAAAKGDDELRRYVAKHFQGAGWKSDVLIREMMDSPDFYASEISQVKVPALHKGRLVLVGDAGYAAGPTGGGTSLALTGAYMLAGEICKHRGDLAAGLKGYEEQMRPIVTELQKIPPLVFTVMAPQTAWGIWLRNHIFAFIAWTGLVEFIQRFFGTAFASTDTVPIPEYDWVA